MGFARILASIVLGGVVVAGVAFAPVPDARAAHCSAPLVLNSGYGTPDNEVLVPGPQPHPFPACSLHWLVPQEDYDTRRIMPAATHVTPSYLADLGTPTITATLNGMGFSNRTITLHRTVLAGGAVLYAGDWLRIPNGPAVMGAITVGAANTTTSFRTVV